MAKVIYSRVITTETPWGKVKETLTIGEDGTGIEETERADLGWPDGASVMGLGGLKPDRVVEVLRSEDERLFSHLTPKGRARLGL